MFRLVAIGVAVVSNRPSQRNLRGSGQLGSSPGPFDLPSYLSTPAHIIETPGELPSIALTLGLVVA